MSSNQVSRKFLESKFPKDLSNLIMSNVIHKPFHFDFERHHFVYDFDAANPREELQRIEGSHPTYDDSNEFAKLDKGMTTSFYRCIKGIPKVEVLTLSSKHNYYFAHSTNYKKIKVDEITIDLPEKDNELEFMKYDLNPKIVSDRRSRTPSESEKEENEDEDEEEIPVDRRHLSGLPIVPGHLALPDYAGRRRPLPPLKKVLEPILPKISQLHESLEMDYSIVDQANQLLISLRNPDEIMLHLPDFIDGANYHGRGTYKNGNQVYNIWSGKLYTFSDGYDIEDCMHNTVVLTSHHDGRILVYNLIAEKMSSPLSDFGDKTLIHGGLYSYSDNKMCLIDLYPESDKKTIDVSFLGSELMSDNLGVFSPDGNIYANFYISDCNPSVYNTESNNYLSITISVLIYDLTTNQIITTKRIHQTSIVGRQD
jgi:hypothetical protein